MRGSLLTERGFATREFPKHEHAIVHVRDAGLCMNTNTGYAVPEDNALRQGKVALLRS